jgi:thiamine-phosphate pyrophosphorylase
MTANNHKLQFITHHTERFSYLDSARIALEGGCRWVQLRMKDVEEALMEETAIVVQRICREYGATFIIDDNVALAKRIDADGVHLGKHDMPIATAREILGDGYIIGATVNTFEDVLHHMEAAVPDYFGCGPFRETTTKRNLSPTLGADGYRDIIHKMRGSGINIPVVAIGGIRKEDIPLLLECGISGIALSSSILTADDPVAEMQEIVNLIFK